MSRLRLASIAMLERRKIRGEARIRACSEYSSHPALVDISITLNQVGPRGSLHSDDEEHLRSDNRRTYHVISKDWRSRHLRDFLRLLDLLDLASNFGGATLHLSNGEDAAGQLPDLPEERRELADTRCLLDRTPLVGLPVNFYDEEWLVAQKQELFALLNLQNPVDIEMPQYLKVYAAKALGILRTGCDGRLDWQDLTIGTAEIDHLYEYLRTGQRPPADYGRAS